MDDGWLHLKHGEHFRSQVRIVPGLVPFSHHSSIITDALSVLPRRYNQLSPDFDDAGKLVQPQFLHDIEDLVWISV